MGRPGPGIDWPLADAPGDDRVLIGRGSPSWSRGVTVVAKPEWQLATQVMGIARCSSEYCNQNRSHIDHRMGNSSGPWQLDDAKHGRPAALHQCANAVATSPA